MFIGGYMHLSILADEYLDTIHSLNHHLDELQATLELTQGLEKKRKIRDKIIAHESILRQTTKTYHYVKNYYNSDVHSRSWF